MFIATRIQTARYREKKGPVWSVSVTEVFLLHRGAVTHVGGSSASFIILVRSFLC